MLHIDPNTQNMQKTSSKTLVLKLLFFSAHFCVSIYHSAVCVLMFCLTFMRKLRTLLRTNKVAYVLGRTRREEVVSLQLFVYITMFPAKPSKAVANRPLQGKDEFK